MERLEEKTDNNKRRMPTGKGVMDDKKFNDLVYAYLQSISYKIDSVSEYRFIYKNQLNYARISRELKMNLRTLKSKIKYLFETGFVREKQSGELTIYELPNLKEYYFLIPNETLRYMVDTCNENVIIIYAYLGQLRNALGNKSYFTKGKLLILLGYKINVVRDGAKKIAPSTNQRDWERINSILDMLENKLKLIKTNKIVECEDDKTVTKYFYEISTKIYVNRDW